MAKNSKTMARARAILGEVFGHDDFRGRQADAVESIASGRDTIVLLPTGAGKSVCYQVPGVLEARTGGGTTIVVSPLIALMKDQVEALRGRGVTAAAIHSHLCDFDRIEVSRAFARGELEFLYCSPERAAAPSFRRLLRDARVSLIAIDEAHCLSQWGHDFRPEYLRLAELVELCGVPTIALTATATPEVLDEIGSRLGLQEPTIIRGDFSRPNLTFDVEHHTGDAGRLESVLAALDQADLRGSSSGRAIIYCSTRKKTEKVAKEITSAGWSAIHYHAGRTPLARERAVRAFDAGRRRILVATNAFGMGVNYPDVRLIIHFQAPGSLEAYYQEAGRAGRDGEAARCLMLFGRADLVTQRRLGSSGSSARAQTRDRALAKLEAFACGDSCRQAVMCDHFTGEQSTERCGLCDICRDPKAVVARRPARKKAEVRALAKSDRSVITAAVSKLSRPAGKLNLAKALRGSRAKTVSRAGLLSIAEHGALADYNEASVVAAIDDLLSRGVLEIRGKKYPKIWLKGKPTRRPNTASVARDRPAKRTGKPRRRHHTPITKALDNYRRRRARALGWKPYMVFQKKAIVAIEEKRPTRLDELYAIPGLGPAKVERFGEDILELVQTHWT